MRNNFVSGSAIPRVVLKDFRNVPVPLIPLPEQLAIASVLSSLDDKIDLPHRQNATLEAMAETLFRQMMSEHDLQGLQDGQDCEGSVKSCQSINPENPVQDECEAGAEWKTKPLSSIADFLNGLACQKFPPKNDVEKLPVLKIKDLGSGITENSDWASTDVKQEYIVRNGDVIFAWSASLMVKIWNGDDCILNQHLFKVTSPIYPKWFYYLWCKYHLEEFIAKAASHATTMGHIKRGDLDEAMVLAPSKNELEEMTLTIQPIMDKLIINNNQIRTLTTLRDILLPKLMSGEVRVEM
jgi:type I restriction enzyme S subunit